jgi:hypothetical protein
MRTAMIASLILALTLTAGCRQTETTTIATGEEAQAVAAEMTPEQLGELGAQIEREPERIDEILSERGLTRQSFEDEIRKITEEPEASRRYAQAYENART